MPSNRFKCVLVVFFGRRECVLGIGRPVVVGMVWALAALIWAIFNVLFNLISFKHSVYIWTPYTLILILVMRVCHIGI